MKLYEMSADRLLFVLSNKDMKSLKRAIVPLDCKVVKDNRQVTFSFISEEHYPKKTKEFVEQQAKLKFKKQQEREKEMSNCFTGDKCGECGADIISEDISHYIHRIRCSTATCKNNVGVELKNGDDYPEWVIQNEENKPDGQ